MKYIKNDKEVYMIHLCGILNVRVRTFRSTEPFSYIYICGFLIREIGASDASRPLATFFFEWSPGGFNPHLNIFKVALRLCSLYKIGSNEPDYTGITKGRDKRKTHTHDEEMERQEPP